MNSEQLKAEALYAFRNSLTTRTKLVSSIVDPEKNFYYYEVKASIFLNRTCVADAYGIASSKEEKFSKSIPNDIDSIIKEATSRAIDGAYKRIMEYRQVVKDQ